MKTLIFCTSYATDEHVWNIRQGLWIASLKASGVAFDQLLIVDDASPVLPQWADVELIREQDMKMPEDLSSEREIVLYSFSSRLGRQDVFVFPGWFRSFAFGVLYGAKKGFEKIIHIESDAHIISERLVFHLNNFQQGWFSMWSEKYQMPEIAVQACAGDQIEKMKEFAEKPYSFLSGKLHEELIPFTHVEQSFVGDRYGEDDIAVPRNADFSTQTRLGEKKSYYWWLDKRFTRKLFEASAPFPNDRISGGWSSGENGYRWMVDFQSVMYLPAIASSAELFLHIKIFPCVLMEHTCQHLTLILNGVVLSEVEVRQGTDIYARIPKAIMSQDATNTLTFVHPDAFVPSKYGETIETRNLSLALSYICILSAV